jgi:hypothetical protein
MICRSGVEEKKHPRECPERINISPHRPVLSRRRRLARLFSSVWFGFLGKAETKISNLAIFLLLPPHAEATEALFISIFLAALIILNAQAGPSREGEEES